MPATVVLTGSTGNLGAYLLDCLANDSSVEMIHCLARSADAEHRQAAGLAERGLALALPHPRIRFHVCDFAQPDLGLAGDARAEISAAATHILHAAWPVNFNRHFKSFDKSIKGVKHLIDLALNAPKRPLLFYISSMSAVGDWGRVPGARLKVPEEEVEDWKVARFGYGQSKLVSERLVAEASRQSGLRAANCRVGQVSGPVEHGAAGCWPRQEWCPSLFASSVHLGALPTSLGPLEDVDWVPVDTLARVLVELLLADHPPHGAVAFYHVVNPQTTPWKALLPALQESLGKAVKPVDFPAWVDALKASADMPTAELAKNPAVKLLPYFSELREKAVFLPKARAVQLDTRLTAQKSKTLASMGAVRGDWLALWLKQLDLAI